MPRLFVGTFLEKSEAERAAEAAYALALSMQRVLKIRAGQASKMHLTWAYLGDLGAENCQTNPPSALLKDMQKIAGQVRASKLTFSQVELWQGVLVIKADIDRESHFNDEVEKARLILKTYSEALTRENRPFSPHITLCRFHGHLSREQAEAKLQDLLPLSLKVDNVSLIESLGTGQYQPIQNWALQSI